MPEVHQIVAFLRLPGPLPEELLVVGHLDDKWHAKGVLEPLRHHEGDEVPEMHGCGGRPAARVEVERLSLLHHFADQVEIAVGEEDAAAKPRVQALDVALADGKLLYPLEQLLRYLRRPELSDELRVIDSARDFPGVHLHSFLRLTLGRGRDLLASSFCSIGGGRIHARYAHTHDRTVELLHSVGGGLVARGRREGLAAVAVGHRKTHRQLFFLG
mmetsp:Transcript_49984/g.140090  ORF Transcript_49984/g.140090 Transcript_49984/m.140090 type:complete len:215 (-) Transcript_49984:1307-1951(-)